jgi:dTMP kinase
LSLFITFEGPDGSGKSTQIKLLAKYLEEQEIPYILTREPGGTKISDQIREIILDPNNIEMKNETEVLLYAASRAQHVREKIMPALQQGKVVLCDRFVDASIAYQGYGLGVEIDKVKEVNKFATAGIKPSRTYLLDISPEDGKERMIERLKSQGDASLDRIELKDSSYHEAVRKGFHTLYEENKEHMVLVKANRSIEAITKDIKDDFIEIWKKEKQAIQ